MAFALCLFAIATITASNIVSCFEPSGLKEVIASGRISTGTSIIGMLPI